MGKAIKKTGVVVDESRNLVTVGGKPVRLTPKEYKLLLALGRAEGQTLSRMDLFNAAWSFGDWDKIDDRAIDQHVARLRHKVGAEFIKTVTGYGYQALGVTFEPRGTYMAQVVEVAPFIKGSNPPAIGTRVKLIVVVDEFTRGLREGSKVRLA